MVGSYIDSEIGDNDKVPSCHACMSEGNSAHVYRGVAFHDTRFGQCIRPRHRLIRNGVKGPQVAKDAIVGDVKNMIEKPHEWRKLTASSRSATKHEKEQTRKDAFGFATQKLSKTVKEGCSVACRDKLVMNQKHHRVHCTMWEGMHSDNANDEFERFHVEQHCTEDEGFT